MTASKLASAKGSRLATSATRNLASGPYLAWACAMASPDRSTAVTAPVRPGRQSVGIRPRLVPVVAEERAVTYFGVTCSAQRTGSGNTGRVVMPIFGKRQVEARVTGVTWSRVVQLERQEWVAKRANWTPSDDVRNVEKHTESYLATVTDTQPGVPDANGIPGPPSSSMRTELRFRTYYTYEQREWHKSETLRASGASQDGVAWPSRDLAPSERVRDKKETYTVTFSAGDKSYEVTLTEQEWRALEPGGTCQLTLGLFGGVKTVSPAVG